MKFRKSRSPISFNCPDDRRQLIIYSDLDGTLLDFHTYSPDRALPGVQALKRAAIPLVFCSSKTFAEQRFYQQRLQVEAPLIAENGSAVFIPQEYFEFEYSYHRKADRFHVIELGLQTERILSVLLRIRRSRKIAFRCFSELSVDELSRISGLPPDMARLAQKRDYSETIMLIHADDESRLATALADHGLTLYHGGRFHTVVSNQAGKGRAVTLLNRLFEKKFGALFTLGIGDSANDEPMLQAVDQAFLVQRPDGTWAELNVKAEHIPGVGPEGFLCLIEQVLQTRIE